MSDETLAGASPTEDAPLLPAETSAADSSPAPDKAPDETPADDTGKPARDDDGKFVSAKTQKRIDHLTWEKEQRAREAEYWRAEAMRRQQAEKPVEPPKPPAPIAKPKLADFEYDESRYEAALVEFTRAEARAAAEAVIAERERIASEQARAKSFQQREAEFKSKTPDYESVAYYAPISNEVAEMVRESEIGPEVAYYLGKNPELAQQISQLPERAAAREIGKIEARLSLQREAARAPAPKPPVSQAPPPPPKIEASEPDVSKDPDQMSVNEWLKWRNKQLNRKKA